MDTTGPAPTSLSFSLTFLRGSCRQWKAVLEMRSDEKGALDGKREHMEGQGGRRGGT